jgi:DNA-binding SARP family transcriptional activator/tetratricopeptide (TPR) repeat protein
MITVHTLGTALIAAGKTRITPNSDRKFALLLHLSAERGRRVSRAVLRDLIFPDRSDASAGHSLRELVYQLRQRGIDLDADIDGIRLPVESFRSDVDDIVHGGLADVERLRAVEGGFLPGYAPTHSEAFTEWLEGYRARMTFDLCKALLVQIERARGRSDWMVTEHAARACLALDPLNEEATLALAEILAVGGAKAKAIGLLDRYMEEVGPRSRGVALQAAVLRRRIGERLQDSYPANCDFPILGRQSELTLLNERLALAKTGESQCVVLHGEPGIGKSRVAAECCSWAALAGWRVERVAVQPHDRDRPMAAFVELVPGVLKLPGALGAAPESLAALTKLTKHELGNGTIELESTESSDAVSAAIVRAIGDVIDAVTSEAPLILLVEDVQWLDAESLRTLAGLVSPRHARRLVVLVTTRERDTVRYFARQAERLASIEIVTLPAALCTALVHQSVGQGISKEDQSFREWLVGASGGNPFFLHSLVRHYQTTGQEFSISPTINALLDQRLATLSPPATTVLWTSVALGNHSTIDRLIVALEMPHVDLVTTIRELEVSRLIVQSGNLVTPAHWLISDAVKRKASVIADKIGHRRIATVLEAEARTSNDADKLWDCAQHWLAADDAPRAIEMLTQCAQHSIEIGRLREAAELLLKAASSASDLLRHELACRTIELAQKASETDIIYRAAKMVDQTNRAGVHDEIEMAELLAKSTLLTDNESTLARLNDCILASHADSDHRLNAGRALLILAENGVGKGLSNDAFEALDHLIGFGDQANDPVALKFLVLYHATVGDTRRLGGLSHRLIGVAQGSRPEIAADLYRYAAAGLWRGGEVSEAMATFKRAFESAESVGLRRVQFIVASILGSFSHDIGQDRESRSWMEKAERIADELPALRANQSYIAICFENALIGGDVVELKRLLDAATQYGRPQEAAHSRLARALEVCIKRLLGELVDSPAAVRELTRHHVVRSESGNCSDLEIAIAATLLDENREPEAARLTVLNYLQDYRRGPAPIAAMLRDTIRRLDIRELPSWCHIYEVEA